MKRLFVIGILITGLLFTACKKEKNAAGDEDDFVLIEKLADFYGFWEQMKVSPKTYMIQSYTGFYTGEGDDFSQLAASIEGDNEPYVLIVDGLTFSFSEYYYNQDADVSSSYMAQMTPGFYGKAYDLKFTENSMEAKSDGSIANPEGQVYMPLLFYPVVYDNLTEDEALTAGTTIRWKKDERNEHGVLISIEYHPGTQSDSLNRIDFTEYISRRKALKEDKGEFTFGISDFADFPDNADLDISIQRIGYTTFVDANGDDCTFAGIVISAAGFTLSKGE